MQQANKIDDYEDFKKGDNKESVKPNSRFDGTFENAQGCSIRKIA